MSETIRVKLLRAGAHVPAKATALASGFDIHACIESPVEVGQHPVVIPTGIAMEVPAGLDAQFRPRSGLARQGVLSTFGTLDADYRGDHDHHVHGRPGHCVHGAPRRPDRSAGGGAAGARGVRGSGTAHRDRAGCWRPREHGAVTSLYVIAGACVGAPLRYFVGSHVKAGTLGSFPLGTFVVNVTGCLLIGFILGLAESRDALSKEARLLLVTGFLGSYTTFSAFGWETYDLMRGDELATAIGYAVLSVVVGIVAVWAGVQAARL